MAIAAVVETGGRDWDGASSATRLRPVPQSLALPVPGQVPQHLRRTSRAGSDLRGVDVSDLAPGLDGDGAGGCTGWVQQQARAGVDVARRRARRAAVRRRRRGVLLGTVASGLVCALALPVSALGGSSGARHVHESVVSEAVYVVQPGDTLWSIALRFDHRGDPRALAAALARETGSAVVVPGERIPIP